MPYRAPGFDAPTARPPGNRSWHLTLAPSVVNARIGLPNKKSFYLISNLMVYQTQRDSCFFRLSSPHSLATKAALPSAATTALGCRSPFHLDLDGSRGGLGGAPRIDCEGRCVEDGETPRDQLMVLETRRAMEDGDGHS